ncbi:MAG: DUF4382 domain-containing protein [Candidatus Polarisedimenticolia bacterium]
MTGRMALSCLTSGVLLLSLAACNGGHDDGVSSTSGKGHLAVQLTDAPLDMDTVQSVNVTIDSVEVFTADESSTERIELLPHTETFDLLTLTDGVTTLLAEGDMPVGFYKKIRLGVPQANLVFKDQTVVDLKLDSRKVDINLPFEILLNDSLLIILDFDAAASLHIVETGSDKFILRPVVNAVKGSNPNPIPLPPPTDPNAPSDPNAPGDPNG